MIPVGKWCSLAVDGVGSSDVGIQPVFDFVLCTVLGSDGGAAVPCWWV